VRMDYHGGLTEKNGRIFNFDPSQYSYDAATDTITSNGLILAGNNPDFPTKGVSDSTLTGRQWGIAPRLGMAWSPRVFNDKIVVRAGWGLYYDRGELFAYLSPGFASGVITGGPFGVNQTPPWVSSQTCDPEGFGYVTCPDFANPWGPTLGPPPSGNPKNLNLPNAAVSSSGIPLFSFADYNRANKLPYTMNQTLDIQWQPRNDLVIQIGYVGNLGRHEVVPIPFNQAQIASPTHPIRPGTPQPALRIRPRHPLPVARVVDPVGHRKEISLRCKLPTHRVIPLQFGLRIQPQKEDPVSGYDRSLKPQGSVRHSHRIGCTHAAQPPKIAGLPRRGLKDKVLPVSRPNPAALHRRLRPPT